MNQATRFQRLLAGVCLASALLSQGVAHAQPAGHGDARAAYDEARAALLATGAWRGRSGPIVIGRRLLAGLASAGHDTHGVLRWLERMAQPRWQGDPDPFGDLTQVLWAIVWDTATEADVPTLLRMEAVSWDGAGQAIDGINDRALASASGCTAPSAGEIAAARASLTGFTVLRVRNGITHAETPTPAELDDLAYFLAATTGAGGSISDEATPCPPQSRSSQEEAFRRLDAAGRPGDLAMMIAAEQAYLATLGYPGPVCLPRDPDEPNASGARWVMRRLARHLELAHRFMDAEQLYQRANVRPWCSISWGAPWEACVRPAVRNALRAGRCRAVVPGFLEISSARQKPARSARENLAT